MCTHDPPSVVWLSVHADADFIAFKQQMEGEPEMLPSAEAQLDAKEQERKAALVAGKLPCNRTLSPVPCYQMRYLEFRSKMLHSKLMPVFTCMRCTWNAVCIHSRRG